MAGVKTYRPWLPRQQYLLAPSPQDWLPEDDLAYFILDVVEELDLGPIIAVTQAKDPRGTRPYDPRMMTALLLYGYCVGVRSSRRMESATHRDVAFRVIAAGNHPDHSVISEFRKTHFDAFAGLFVDTVRLARRAGLVKMERGAGKRCGKRCCGKRCHTLGGAKTPSPTLE
ncbi:MAG: transposase, partial [Deltaproteobacteria bacterium]|nr:transposase [Deltaproteobacteria bacterium]